ncbi:MAG: stimulus-sensing domain-containing protein [Alphaproteobacteria bacterium]
MLRRLFPLTARISPLTWRILAVNTLALAILGGSMLYLGRYQERLIQSELEALSFEARIFAGALGEGAFIVGEDERNMLSPDLARSMVRRLVESSDSRMRLFDDDGALIADSRILSGTRAAIQIEDIPPPPNQRLGRFWWQLTQWVAQRLPKKYFAPYDEKPQQDAEQYMIAGKALVGTIAAQVWRLPKGGLMLGVAVPVQGYKQVLGAVMVTRSSAKIDAALADVRADVLKAFLAVLVFTVLLSAYLARTIAEPLRRLASAVQDVQQDQAQATGLGGGAALLAQRQIPDLTARHDEIGELSRALREMTAALAVRLSAIENFAADVAHEIKNPLTSLRSAVETAGRVKDPERLQKLMAVIQDDVLRLDRLITDISSASRLDAELSRAATELIDIGQMLATLADYYAPVAASGATAARVTLTGKLPLNLKVRGVEGRLTQVLKNLIDNALSFTPSGSTVCLAAERDGAVVKISVEDDGPGIPETRLATIFDRFYSERPKTEKFGTHSGLGLSIAKQITEAHRGKIWAENRTTPQGVIHGARFCITLPLAE